MEHHSTPRGAEGDAAFPTPTPARLARVEEAYARVDPDAWASASWPHEYRDDEGDWHACRGGHPDDCYVCATTEEGRTDAEDAAYAALEAAREGDWAMAAVLARRVARLEAKWGGERRPVSRPEDADLTPVWGAFVATVIAAADEVAS